MVAKVIGKVDSQDVIFKDMGQGRWSVVVPYDQDGEYIVEVTAIDEAGNVAYATKYLIMVDLQRIECKILPFPYVSVLLPISYTSVLLPKNYETDFLLPPKYGTDFLFQKNYETDFLG